MSPLLLPPLSRGSQFARRRRERELEREEDERDRQREKEEIEALRLEVMERQIKENKRQEVSCVYCVGDLNPYQLSCPGSSALA